MNNIYFICFFVGLFGVSYESCFYQIFQSDSCTASNGVTIPVGADLRIPEKCLDCSCSAGSPGQAAMGCCVYGVHAGIMIPPKGCKIITEADGCTPKIVVEGDESKLCAHK
ncbi:uncharacterized protein LOC123561768 [Mercenaria mercenaria]|uniref:uncharacterized protein LOC123561768 n=1 Tax=Mercenaria mercenaria TaxID=6596 RepID=UPI001E1D5F33|nr:uncharacterized protein LOC123561768 [Mercenaria mercenaria]